MSVPVSLQQLQAHAREAAGGEAELACVQFAAEGPVDAAALAGALGALLAESDPRRPDGAPARCMQGVALPAAPEGDSHGAAPAARLAALLLEDGADCAAGVAPHPGGARVLLCCRPWLMDADGLSLAAHSALGQLAGAPPRPGVPRYPDYAQWQRELLSFPESDFGRQYWTRQAAAFRAVTHVGLEERLRPARPAPACFQVQALPPESGAALAAFAARHRLPEPVLALACWILVLELLRPLGQKDLVLALSGRGDDAAETTLGRFHYEVPVPFAAPPSLPFLGFVQSVQQQWEEAEEWKECFGEAHFAADLGGQGLRFAWRPLRAALAWSELPAAPVNPCSGLEFVFLPGLPMRAALAGDPSRYAPATLAFLLDCWQDMLHEGLRAPARLLGELRAGRPAPPVATPPAGGRDAAAPQALLPAWREHAARTALRNGGRACSYAELEQRVAARHAAFAQAGLAAGDVVALALADPVEHLVAVLAALRLGAAFVTPAQRLPAARRDAVLGQARARMLADDAGLHALAASPRPQDSELHPPARLHPQLPAYLMLTSGSTGVPRPVAVPRQALANQLDALAHVLPLAPGARVLTRTPPSFDAWIWEVLHPLACGAQLELLAFAEAFDERAILDAVAREAIELVQMTPSLLRGCLRADRAGVLRGLRYLVLGGERLPADLLAPFEESGVTVVNAYGPTETCVNASLEFSREARHLRSVPLGTPLPGYAFHVLDAALQPVPVGREGMLFIGGEGLAQWAGGAAATAADFLPDPFAGVPGARMYRTGDQVRVLPGGGFEYLGRLDQQLKVNGVRIDGVEVAKALREQPGVRDAAVFAAEAAGAGARLVACIVPESANNLSVAALDLALRRRLPPWMCPASILPFEAFPLSAHGKLDASALREAAAARLAQRYVAARTATEEAIAACCARVLDLERIGVEDNFFLAGGHSLSFARLVVQLRALFGLELPLESVLTLSSVAALAEHVDRALAARTERRDG